MNVSYKSDPYNPNTQTIVDTSINSRESFDKTNKHLISSIINLCYKCGFEIQYTYILKLTIFFIKREKREERKCN